MLHIYCGDGKGKTTAALGLAVRAAGNGMRVHFLQFLKGGETSELHSLAQLPQITVLRCDRMYGFTFQMDDEERAALIACHNRMLREAAVRLEAGGTDLLVLDEFFSACNYGLFDHTLAEQLVFHCPENTELVLTGREPAQKYLDAADYISEIHAVRHPYTRGVTARRGIEY
jgi:cob(I)alamin adenosyltransferase